MVLQHGYVAADAADADLAARELNHFYNYFGAWFLNKRPVTQGLIEPLTDAEIAAHPFYSAEVMRKNLLIGDKYEVIDKLAAIKALGYDEFSFWIDSGQSFARKKAGLKRFIEDVMPALA
jgi:alkanesulfonate monooxygenase SsuD/methylene tetrahydromethanopterin reductase-like flavin-dependent oxidoreductase (luciferase family)